MDKSRNKSGRKIHRKIYKKVSFSDIQVGDRFTHILAPGDVWYIISGKLDDKDMVKVCSGNSSNSILYPMEYFIEGMETKTLIRLPRKSIYCI